MNSKLLSVLLAIAMIIASIPALSILNYSYDYQIPVDQDVLKLL